MAPPPRPPASVLAALGLTGALGTAVTCGNEAGPCLSVVAPNVDPDPNDEQATGPCLEMPPEVEPDKEKEAHLGPCLKVAMHEPPPEPPIEEVEMHACLDMAAEPPPPPKLHPCLSPVPSDSPPPAKDDAAEEAGDDDGAQGNLGPLQRVLDRQVLPEDVAALLRSTRTPKA